MTKDTYIVAANYRQAHDFARFFRVSRRFTFVRNARMLYDLTPGERVIFVASFWRHPEIKEIEEACARMGHEIEYL